MPAHLVPRCRENIAIVIVPSERHNSSRRLPIFVVVLTLGILPFVCWSLPVLSLPVTITTSSQSPIVAKTELVVLPANVTDGSGNFIAGLGIQDFHVYEDGRLQKIVSFQDGNNPVTVGLVVDHSRSMGPKLSGVVAAVSAFAQSSNPLDQMFVVDFNDDVSVELLNGKAFTNNAHELEKAVSAVRARGRTALYDAVAEGLIHLKLGRWDKKALIIVSDGGDNASQQKFSQVLALARQSQAVIYSVGLVDSDEEENPGILQRLSKDTGGIAFFPSSSEGVADVSQKIARDLREQYTLGFIPEATGASDSMRRIKVEVAAPGHGKIRVRTRSGYSRADQNQAGAKSGKSPS
jgi:Ca-activated chloride channel family protein